VTFRIGSSKQVPSFGFAVGLGQGLLLNLGKEISAVD
jgi:hypothetical protein